MCLIARAALLLMLSGCLVLVLRNFRNRETEREKNVIKTREIPNSEMAVSPLFHVSVLAVKW